MSEHSIIGPSALHRLLECPGSHKLTEGVPQGASSSYAAEGTVAHGIVEWELGPQSTDQTLSVGDVVVEDGHEITVDQDMLDGAHQMVSFCRPIQEAADRHWVEERVDMGALWNGDPPEPFFGTMDFGAYIEATDTLYVVDFKYGRMDVDPDDNPQALAYALGAVYKLGKTPANIVIVIIQPRGQSNNPVKMYHTTGLDLWMWADEILKPGIDRLFSDGAPLSPGEWCRFCPGKIRCPALHKLAKETSRAEFGEVPPDPMNFSGEDLGKILTAIPLITQWFEAIRAEASGRIEKNKSVPGWKLVPKRAMRKWASAAEVERQARLGNWSVFKEVLLSPTQIEKQDPEVYEELDRQGLVDQTSSGTTLAPDTDNRPGIKGISAKDEFDVVDDVDY